MTESKLTAAFLKKLRLWYAGSFVWKVQTPSRAGMPDAFIFWNRKTIAVEFKKHPYKVQEIQRLTHLELERAGVNVVIVVFFEDRIELRHGTTTFATFQVVDAAIRRLMECE